MQKCGLPTRPRKRFFSRKMEGFAVLWFSLLLLAAVAFVCTASFFFYLGIASGAKLADQLEQTLAQAAPAASLASTPSSASGLPDVDPRQLQPELAQEGPPAGRGRCAPCAALRSALGRVLAPRSRGAAH